MNLYELTTELAQAMNNLVIDEETGEVSGFEAVDALDVAFEDKAEAYAVTIKNLLAFANEAKGEADKLKARADAAKNRADQLKQHLALSMNAVGKNKVETARAALSFRKSTVVNITDETVLRDDLWKVTMKREPNKTEIGTLLKSGESVPGAELETRMNLQVK